VRLYVIEIYCFRDALRVLEAAHATARLYASQLNASQLIAARLK